MRGTNPIRSPETGDGLVLQVQHIFPTLQGEGPLAGTPAVFLRLGGCNLACDFCDTEFESFAPMALDAVVKRVIELSHRHPATHAIRAHDPTLTLRVPQDDHTSAGMTRLVVITGGEPLRQNIVPLCEHLLAAGFQVQIETNGTLWRPLPKDVSLVCSPKNTGEGYFHLRPDVLSRADALKFIISATHPLYREVGNVGQNGLDVPVYVQPMDEYNEAKNRANVAHALALAQTHGYKLSLQLHKMLEIE